MPVQKIGQYRVIERLGAGGMATVYRAVDESLGRDVALKILDTTLEGSPARLRAEAAALARLNHPGIATVYELIEDDTRLVLAMELVRGQTLQHILEQVGVFTPRRAAELCMQALAILAHAHGAGVVHRDLKPGNLMITETGTLKIMDFGIARLDGAINLTNAGTMLGTPAYMAPEQVLGHPIDARADLYAMGVVFFRLLTAGLPFKADNPFDMAQAQVNEVPAKARDLRSELPPWVDEILTRALAKKPADRFQSAVEFHEAFARSTADAPLPVVVSVGVEKTEVMVRPEPPQPKPAPQAPPPQAARRRPQLVWLSAAVIVIAASAWIFIPRTAATAETRPPTPEPTPPTVATETPTPTPTAVAVSDVAAAPSKTPAPPAAPTPAAAHTARPTATFSGVKFLAVDGTRTSTSDVVVALSDLDITVHSSDPKSAAQVIPYKGIVKATYVRAKDPKWDASLSAPSGKINVPGILGRARHWLVLQGADRYLILRLDGDDRLDVMSAFEQRAGITIEK